MAIVTKVIATANEDGAQARLEYDYDDADLRIRVVRVVNDHPTYGVRATARRSNGTGQERAVDCPPADTRTVNVPTTVANRIQLSNYTNGRLNGIETTLAWVP